jgi:hypothetical protein
MTDSTGPATPSDRTKPWRAIAVVGGAIVVAVVVIAALTMRDNDADTASPGSASPVPSASPVSSDSVADSPSTPAATPSPSATAEAAAAIPENWAESAVFAENGRRYVVGDLVAWSGGLVAAGTVYEGEARSVFGPPPQHAGRVWRSTDGTDWTDATPSDTFGDVELMHLFETSDGALVVIGQVYEGELDPTSAAWETLDGETWTPIALTGMPEGVHVIQVASGARGHVASSFVVAEPRPLYSADGRTWQATLGDGIGIGFVAAGDEGFVSSTFSTEPQGSALRIVASADGHEWFDATESFEGSFLAAPRGADWIATNAEFGTVGESLVDVTTWQSANGLDWSPLGQLTLESVELDGATCFETVGALHGLPTMTVAGTILSGPCGEGAVVTAGGSYATIDGIEWTRLPFGDSAYAAAAVDVGDRVVIATDTRTNQAPVIGVTFWISEAP